MAYYLVQEVSYSVDAYEMMQLFIFGRKTGGLLYLLLTSILLCTNECYGKTPRPLLFSLFFAFLHFSGKTIHSFDRYLN